MIRSSLFLALGIFFVFIEPDAATSLAQFRVSDYVERQKSAKSDRNSLGSSPARVNKERAGERQSLLIVEEVIRE